MWRIVPLLFAVCLLAGCSTETGISHITESSYVLQSEKDVVQLPNIRLNGEDNTFTLENDVLSSLMCVSGTYKIENNILTASADSGEKYVFEVVDDDTLRYVRKGSNVIGYVEDGSSFILVTE